MISFNGGLSVGLTKHFYGVMSIRMGKNKTCHPSSAGQADSHF